MKKSKREHQLNASKCLNLVDLCESECSGHIVLKGMADPMILTVVMQSEAVKQNRSLAIIVL